MFPVLLVVVAVAVAVVVVVVVVGVRGWWWGGGGGGGVGVGVGVVGGWCVVGGAGVASICIHVYDVFHDAYAKFGLVVTICSTRCSDYVSALLNNGYDRPNMIVFRLLLLVSFADVVAITLVWQVVVGGAALQHI